MILKHIFVDASKQPQSFGSGQQRNHHPRPFFYVQPPSQPYYLYPQWQLNNPYSHIGLPGGMYTHPLLHYLQVVRAASLSFIPFIFSSSSQLLTLAAPACTLTSTCNTLALFYHMLLFTRWITGECLSHASTLLSGATYLASSSITTIHSLMAVGKWPARRPKLTPATL